MLNTKYDILYMAIENASGPIKDSKKWKTRIDNTLQPDKGFSQRKERITL